MLQARKCSDASCRATTAPLHHVDIAALERAFRRQKRLASARLDGMTVAAYEQNLEAKENAVRALTPTAIVTNDTATSNQP